MHIALVLGKPIARDSPLVETIDRLHHSCPRLSLLHLEPDHPMPDWLLEVDLVVQRGLDSARLATISTLESAGVRCCNRVAASQGAFNQANLMANLAADNIRVPVSRIVDTWEDVLTAASERQIVVKRVVGGAGRGASVLLGAVNPLPPTAPFEPPYLVQQYVPNDGTVAKVYVIGENVHGIEKYYGDEPSARDAGTPLQIDSTLKRLARRVATSTGLELFGFDVIHGDGSPCVIDVNVFPAYRGVPRAPRLVAAYLLGITPLTRDG